MTEKSFKIIFFGNGDRSVPCLELLLSKGYEIVHVVAHPASESKWFAKLERVAQKNGIAISAPTDPNVQDYERFLAAFAADLFILGGYGKILRQNIFSLPKLMTINLHGGKLPKYRGSSPMNWALINGEKEFSLSVVQVDSRVDGGPVLLEKTFPIGLQDTIVDLHHKAGDEFPTMLLHAVENLRQGRLALKPQKESDASYYPLRFPDDGFVLWDALTAVEIHNRVRALTQPYPCAFSFFQSRKIKLITSELQEMDFFGEPGRVYRKTDKGILVCASDKCLWIRNAIFDDTGEPALGAISRYDKFLTMKDAVLNAALNEPERLFGKGRSS